MAARRVRPSPPRRSSTFTNWSAPRSTPPLEPGCYPPTPRRPCGRPIPETGHRRAVGRRRGQPARLHAFLEASASDRHWMLFRLAAATGMRRGELLGLRWTDVHLDAGRVEVTQALTAVGTSRPSPSSRPRPAGAASPSTPTRSSAFARGGSSKRRRSDPPAALTSSASSSREPTAESSTPTWRLRPSRGSYAGSRSGRSACTTCAIPTRPSCCGTACRSRSCPNGSGTRRRRSRWRRTSTFYRACRTTRRGPSTPSSHSHAGAAGR